MSPRLVLAAAFAFALPASAANSSKHPKFGFPVYSNAPAGKQLSGQHAPASTPALTPEEEQKTFKLPPGFEVRLFAAEPDLANPVAMSWDDRGRLWVVELYEYPLGARPGSKGRDRIKVLEDTDGDGRVDKVTVFADGLSLATGILVANGGVYVGEAPNLWFYEDTNGDDVADKRTAVLTGFGLEDRHELLNGFTWGPDGQMYLTHGVFTQTKARNPEAPKAEPVVLTAGVARFNPKTRSLEVFAEGTSNPWGVDFDAKGNAFVSACVIDHLFHLAPGGLYARQAGQPPFPFAYEMLSSIVDFKHHMAAYAGIDIYQGNQWPAAWRGEALLGNIHQNALNNDHLEAEGSSFRASNRPDFLTTTDGWFMPVSSQTGPDGAVWVMDWYDKYPCYQNANADPDGVDRERGRIWRVVWTGDEPGKPVPSRPNKEMNLGALPSAELVKLLAHPNEWQRRMAQRLLNGRRDVAGQRDALVAQFKDGAGLDARLASLWTLYSAGLMNGGLLDDAAADRDAAARMWSARFTGEQRDLSETALKRLEQLARDPDATVRAAVATACRQYVSSQLTVNAPLPEGFEGGKIAPVLAALIESSKAADDRTVDFLIWMAAEPLVAASPDETLHWLAEHGSDNMPLSGLLAAKTLRRLCDSREPKNLDLMLEFLGELPEAAAPFTAKAIEGLLEGQRGKAITPSVPTAAVLKKLLASSNPDLSARAQQLGALWGDAAAFQAVLAKVNDPGAPEAARLAAIQSARQQKTDDSRAALFVVVSGPSPDGLKVEAVRALADVGVDDTGRKLLAGWKGFSPAVQRAVAEVCTTRAQWRWPLFAAVEAGDVKRGDIPPTVIRALANSKADAERAKAQQLFGHVNQSSAEKLRLIGVKRKVVTDGPVDLAAGHDVAKKTCFTCHKLYGEGADIGPDLTGVGRSSLDALLHNVINPNEIIGQGYENVEIETYDSRQFSGRVLEDNKANVKLVMAGPAEVVVPKSDIKIMRVTDNSVMPEGLEQMPDADFRNLIWYLLAPPQDGKPLTDERRRELIGGAGADQTSIGPARDGESLALWAPGWQLDCPDFEDAPAKLPEFAGRRNVLMTHPVDDLTPAALVRPLVLASGRRATLTVAVAARERGDWELCIKADGEVIHRQRVGYNGGRWETVKLDLSPLAGRRVVLRLENGAGEGPSAFGYWADLRLDLGEVAAK